MVGRQLRPGRSVPHGMAQAAACRKLQEACKAFMALQTHSAFKQQGHACLRQACHEDTLGEGTVCAPRPKHCCLQRCQHLHSLPSGKPGELVLRGVQVLQQNLQEECRGEGGAVWKLTATGPEVINVSPAAGLPAMLQPPRYGVVESMEGARRAQGRAEAGASFALLA